MFNQNWQEPLVFDWFGLNGPPLTEDDISNSFFGRMLRGEFDAPSGQTGYSRQKPWWNPRNPFAQHSSAEYIPGKQKPPQYPRLSSLTKAQHMAGLRVLTREYTVQPWSFPAPRQKDFRVFENVKDIYETEQQEYRLWARDRWVNGDSVRTLQPTPLLEKVYDAQFELKKNAIHTLAHEYTLAAQIKLEPRMDAFEFLPVRDLKSVDLDLLPTVDYPSLLEADVSILREYEVPVPCRQHPTRFILPYENTVTTLPLPEVNKQLAHFAVEYNAPCIASEKALQCLLETEQSWKLPVSVVDVECLDGGVRTVVVLSSDFNVQKECGAQRTYKAYKHLLRNTFKIPCEDFESSPPTRRPFNVNDVDRFFSKEDNQSNSDENNDKKNKECDVIDQGRQTTESPDGGGGDRVMVFGSVPQECVALGNTLTSSQTSRRGSCSKPNENFESCPPTHQPNTVIDPDRFHSREVNQSNSDENNDKKNKEWDVIEQGRQTTESPGESDEVTNNSNEPRDAGLQSCSFEPNRLTITNQLRISGTITESDSEFSVPDGGGGDGVVLFGSDKSYSFHVGSTSTHSLHSRRATAFRHIAGGARSRRLACASWTRKSFKRPNEDSESSLPTHQPNTVIDTDRFHSKEDNQSNSDENIDKKNKEWDVIEQGRQTTESSDGGGGDGVVVFGSVPQECVALGNTLTPTLTSRRGSWPPTRPRNIYSKLNDSESSLPTHQPNTVIDTDRFHSREDNQSDSDESNDTTNEECDVIEQGSQTTESLDGGGGDGGGGDGVVVFGSVPQECVTLGNTLPPTLTSRRGSWPLTIHSREDNQSDSDESNDTTNEECDVIEQGSQTTESLDGGGGDGVVVFGSVPQECVMLGNTLPPTLTSRRGSWPPTIHSREDNQSDSDESNDTTNEECDVIEQGSQTTESLDGGGGDGVVVFGSVPQECVMLGNTLPPTLTSRRGSWPPTRPRNIYSKLNDSESSLPTHQPNTVIDTDRFHSREDSQSDSDESNDETNEECEVIEQGTQTTESLDGDGGDGDGGDGVVVFDSDKSYSFHLGNTSTHSLHSRRTTAGRNIAGGARRRKWSCALRARKSFKRSSVNTENNLPTHQAAIVQDPDEFNSREANESYSSNDDELQTDVIEQRRGASESTPLSDDDENEQNQHILDDHLSCGTDRSHSEEANESYRSDDDELQTDVIEQRRGASESPPLSDEDKNEYNQPILDDHLKCSTDRSHSVEANESYNSDDDELQMDVIEQRHGSSENPPLSDDNRNNSNAPSDAEMSNCSSDHSRLIIDDQLSSKHNQPIIDDHLSCSTDRINSREASESYSNDDDKLRMDVIEQRLGSSERPPLSDDDKNNSNALSEPEVSIPVKRASCQTEAKLAQKFSIYFGTDSDGETEFLNESFQTQTEAEIEVAVPHEEQKQKSEIAGISTEVDETQTSDQCSFDTTTFHEAINDINGEKLSSRTDINDIHCTCKDSSSASEAPPPRSFTKWQIKNATSNRSCGLIVHSSHKVRLGDVEMILEPIVEWQPELGACEQSEGKLRALALAMMMRPDSQILNARIDYKTGNIIVINTLTEETFTNQYGDKRSEVAARIQATIDQLRLLKPGQYILEHDPGHGEHAMVYAAQTEPAGAGFSGHTLSLRPETDNMTSTEEAALSKIPPELSPAMLPYHKDQGILPLAFTADKNHVQKYKKAPKATQPGHDAHAMVYSAQTEPAGAGFSGHTLSLHTETENMTSTEEAALSKITPEINQATLPYHKDQGILPLAFTADKNHVQKDKKAPKATQPGHDAHAMVYSALAEPAGAGFTGHTSSLHTETENLTEVEETALSKITPEINQATLPYHKDQGTLPLAITSDENRVQKDMKAPELTRTRTPPEAIPPGGPAPSGRSKWRKKKKKTKRHHH